MDMQDRELLEMAAKAAGISGVFVARYAADGYPHDFVGIGRSSATIAPLWNPLTDDGDALRLASRLHLCVCHALGGVVGAPGTVMVGLNMWGNRAPLVFEWYSGSGDADEAVRRAITRAAAAMAKEGSANGR